MTTSTYTTTEDGGRQNIFATEPRTQVVEDYASYSIEAEKANGRWAVVTGPYNSKELAKSSMEGRRNDVYVVPGRDIEFN